MYTNVTPNVMQELGELSKTLAFATKLLSEGVDGSRPDTAVPSYSWYEYWYRGTTVLACDARVVPVDLAYVIFIDFLALGVLRFCFLLLSNVQFLVLVNLPPGRSHAGGISSRHSRRQYPFRELGSV